MNILKRLALIAFIAVEVLLLFGGIVRATGSGLGCPDWPFCYGRMVPPTRVEDIDFEELNLEKFRQKAAQHGRDPRSITPESIAREFDATHTWIEYVNRLSALPVGLAVIALLVASVCYRRERPQVLAASILGTALVGVNAWLGAKVVLSALRPGIITLHMGLTIVLLCVLVYACWAAGDDSWRPQIRSLHLAEFSSLRLFAGALFVLVVAEAVLGSQVREMTDYLARTHENAPRAAWTRELEATAVYLIHRSGYWLILISAVVFYQKARTVLMGGAGWLEQSVLGLVLVQMILGLILAQVGIIPTAQVLHVGASSLLVSGLFLWLLGSSRVLIHD